VTNTRRSIYKVCHQRAMAPLIWFHHRPQELPQSKYISQTQHHLVDNAMCYSNASKGVAHRTLDGSKWKLMERKFDAWGTNRNLSKLKELNFDAVCSTIRPPRTKDGTTRLK